MGNRVVAPGVRTYIAAAGASTASTGDVLTYTAPANRRAHVIAISALGVSPTVDVQYRLVLGGATFGNQVNPSAGANVLLSSPFMGHTLEPGDTASWFVSAATVATTADFAIFVIEEA